MLYLPQRSCDRRFIYSIRSIAIGGAKEGLHMKQTKPLSLIAGENLNRLMKTHRLKQEQFAEAFGAAKGYDRLDARTVRWWLTNGIIRVDTVGAVAEFFGISLMEMLNEHT